MALSSGVPGNEKKGSFAANAGYEYDIVPEKGALFLDFHKQGTARIERRPLNYFVGSGTAARSFLISVDNFLYEAPATYYNRLQAWAPSPNYERYTYPFLTRAIAPGCLQCHATEVRAVSRTQNDFDVPPFRESGIGCERCHGPGGRHAASGKAGDIINPASLAPPQRDSICGQCHLSGEIRVDRARKSMADFVAGDKLSDYTVAFVRAGSAQKQKVTSHVENLAQSACSRGSGQRLWCGTCHDPHFVPAPAQKAAWFRSKCETCHADSECGRGSDCVACHMPKNSVTDAEHVVYTDHSIPRRPGVKTQTPLKDAALVPFGGQEVTSRDLGLAYAIVALREQNPAYSSQAFDLLREAERRSPGEPQTLAYLADLYTNRKDDRNAAVLYEKLYAIDPSQSSAPAHLGAYQMEQGNNQEAIRLFRQALQISPALLLVRMNLAAALMRTGQNGEARSVLNKALEFNPSFTAARELLTKIR